MSNATLLSMLSSSTQAQPGYGWHMHDGPGYMMGYDWGGWWIVHAIFWLAIPFVILVLVWLLARKSGNESAKRDSSEPRSALDLLDERYARGEIDREDYLQRKKDIGER